MLMVESVEHVQVISQPLVRSIDWALSGDVAFGCCPLQHFSLPLILVHCAFELKNVDDRQQCHRMLNAIAVELCGNCTMMIQLHELATPETLVSGGFEPTLVDGVICAEGMPDRALELVVGKRIDDALMQVYKVLLQIHGYSRR